ncbi:hypothetical protein K7X08_007049 [Anisodus acutangulus]|uniref:Uncharacterized protein n=1 Tax=Anisodus acutangulus TaxID=402998 RepID=A0A9Q1LFC5_9SOLA|nr:hypothetical protein K7X08_007049 [Anisodus acutangulus]
MIPQLGDKEIDEIVEKIVSGLFCVLATLVVVPVIRCPHGCPTEMVESLLDQRLQDGLLAKNNLFSEGVNFTSSLQRLVLCLFDWNFELAVAIQHDFRYWLLVHDVLGLRLNRLSVQGDKGWIKTYKLDRSDSFWMANMSLEFPEVAESQLNKYKKDVEEAEKLCGQSINYITAGMKNLFSGDHHLALMRAVEALMEGKPNPEIESYLLLDPRAPKSSSASSSGHLKRTI